MTRVAVLMCTFNGERYLRQQLETIAAQNVPELSIWISDDGSRDGTREVVDDFARGWDGELHWLEGPGRGFAENFRSLICNESIDADYFGFSDQDDLWDEGKVMAALDWHQSHASAGPALYGGRTRIVDRDGCPRGMSPLFQRPASFRNAIVQNIAGGNTMLVNRSARQILLEHGHGVRFAAHDWWCYLMVTACGGDVRYDPVPRMGYRQHENNAIGENSSARARWARYRFLISGGYRCWMEMNFAALEGLRPQMTPDNLHVLEEMQAVHRSRGITAMRHLRRAGVYRQTDSQTGIYAAAMLGLL